AVGRLQSFLDQIVIMRQNASSEEQASASAEQAVHRLESFLQKIEAVCP
ncbi:MAG: hypothetical protein HQL55_16920, partial [Magnetococcales bacterium]|nr:hypothetical protein [Magnetococcales bacterium]